MGSIIYAVFPLERWGIRDILLTQRSKSGIARDDIPPDYHWMLERLKGQDDHYLDYYYTSVNIFCLQTIEVLFLLGLHPSDNPNEAVDHNNTLLTHFHDYTQVLRNAEERTEGGENGRQYLANGQPQKLLTYCVNTANAALDFFGKRDGTLTLQNISQALTVDQLAPYEPIQQRIFVHLARLFRSGSTKIRAERLRRVLDELREEQKTDFLPVAALTMEQAISTYDPDDPTIHPEIIMQVQELAHHTIGFLETCLPTPSNQAEAQLLCYAWLMKQADQFKANERIMLDVRLYDAIHQACFGDTEETVALQKDSLEAKANQVDALLEACYLDTLNSPKLIESAKTCIGHMLDRFGCEARCPEEGTIAAACCYLTFNDHLRGQDTPPALLDFLYDECFSSTEQKSDAQRETAEAREERLRNEIHTYYEGQASEARSNLSRHHTNLSIGDLASALRATRRNNSDHPWRSDSLDELARDLIERIPQHPYQSVARMTGHYLYPVVDTTPVDMEAERVWESDRSGGLGQEGIFQQSQQTNLTAIKGDLPEEATLQSLMPVTPNSQALVVAKHGYHR